MINAWFFFSSILISEIFKNFNKIILFNMKNVSTEASINFAFNLTSEKFKIYLFGIWNHLSSAKSFQNILIIFVPNIRIYDMCTHNIMKINKYTKQQQQQQQQLVIRTHSLSVGRRCQMSDIQSINSSTYSTLTHNETFWQKAHFWIPYLYTYSKNSQ